MAEPEKTKKAVAGLIQRVTYPVLGKEDEVLDRKGAFLCAATWAGAGLLAGGMIGRHRAEQGKKPILNFAF